jgi:hypothetical protein
MSAVLAAHDHDISTLGPLEWMGVGLAGVFVVWVIWRAVVLTIHPGEEEPDHIKRMILDDDAPIAKGPKPHGASLAAREE